jgi:hypothetical protein
VLLLRWARVAASSRFLRGRGGRVVRAVILVPEKVTEKVEIFGELCGYFGQFRRLRDKLASRARVPRDEMGRRRGGGTEPGGTDTRVEARHVWATVAGAVLS